MDDKHKIEAVLYTTGRYMTVQEIAESCEIGSVGYVKEHIQELIKEYAEKNSALEIQEHEGMYKLNIKKQYGYLANKLLGEGDMDKPTIKTLAVIAYKNPALQSDIIKTRGNKAYDHITTLIEQGLIVRAEKQGRSRLLKLTPKFFEYFDIAETEIKDHFKHTQEGITEKVAWKMGIDPKELHEQERLQKEKKSSEPSEENSPPPEMLPQEESQPEEEPQNDTPAEPKT